MNQSTLKKGQYVSTPRFLTVKLDKVFSNQKNALNAKYTEPTHYDNNPAYGILGKHIGPNRMTFAGYKK